MLVETIPEELCVNDLAGGAQTSHATWSRVRCHYGAAR